MRAWKSAILERTVGLCGLLFGVGSMAFGQPVCSVTIDPDVTICQGQTTVLHGPPGYSNYLWSTGSGNQNITVLTAGTYWCQVSYPSPQLITNGNFNAVNTGFSSQFNYNSTLTTDGNYWIGTNAASYHPQFSGTGNGNFMIVNSGWPSALWNVWCQDVVVCPGQTYTLSYRARTLSNATPARLQWWIDGVMVGPEVVLPAFGTGWQTITQPWTTGASQSGATICLRAMSGDGIGNDIGLDDLSLLGTIVLRDSVNVSVTPLPSFDLGPTTTLCTGQSTTLDASVAGGTYVWQDGSTNSSFNVTAPGNYSVTVTANNCWATDNVQVFYNPVPVVDLGPDQTLCTGETTLLDATLPGATYTWQDGSSASTFNVSGPGTYGVGVVVNGCFSSDAVDIAYNPTPTPNLGPDLVFCAGGQATLDATTAGATYLWSDGSTGATFNVNSTGTYAVDVTVNGCTGSDAVDVNVTPLPVVNIGADQTVCPGTVLILNATTAGASYLWNDGSMGATLSTSTPGNYSVQVTVNGCSATDAMVLTNHVLPVFDLGPDQTICAGLATGSFSANVAGATYMWSTGANGTSIQPSAAGAYWLDVTTNGCTVRDSVDLIVTPLPVFSLGNDLSVCPGITTTLDATTSGATYVWNTGASSPTLTVGPGSYSVQVTVSGCPASDAIDVGAYAAATVSLGADATLCPGDDLLLDVTQPGASYTWQDGSTGATYLIQSGGPVSVQLTDANGCIATDGMIATYAAPVPIDLGVDAAICQGDQLVLDATVPGATYLWNTGAQSATIAVTTTGTYSVAVTQGSCTVSDAIDVSTVALPVADLGPDQTLCTGDVITLDATTAGVTYLWNTGEQTSTIDVVQGGTYSVTLTNAAGCAATDAVDVIEATPDAIDLGADLTLCQGESVALDATLPGATYTWSTTEQTPSITVGASGTYWVQATQGVCSVSDTVEVTVNPVPTVALGVDLTLCAGDDVTLDATYAGATYLWNTGANTPTLTVSTANTYSVVVDLNGCTATDAVDIGVLNLNAIDLGSDVILCAGETVTLDATMPGVSYLWSTGDQTPTITVNSTGNYSVTASQGACSVSDAVQVTVNPMPSVALGNDLTLCAGDDVTLDATYAGATYLWNTGANTPTLTVSTANTYSVVVDLNGCTATDAVDIGVLSLSAIDLGSDVILCDGETVTLDATMPGVSYLWSTGDQTPTITVGSTGNYSVTASQGACSVTDAVQVTVNPMPSVALGNDLTLCAGDDVTLDATYAAATYLWSTGANTPTLTVNTANTYSVVVDLNGCTATDAIVVGVLSLNAIDLGSDVILCDGETVTLDATMPGVSYLWSTGDQTPTITVGATGNYSVTASQGACSVTDAVQVTVNPMPSVALGNDLTLCAGDDVTLDATYGGATYLWNTGANTPTITVSTANTYSVVVDLNGCTATDAIVVGVLSLSAIDLGSDVILCDGETVTLDATMPGVSYLWSTGDQTPTITVGATGSYSVTASQGACSVNDSVQVTVNPMPSVALGTDLTLCAGDDVTLDATFPGATYLWNTGVNTPTLTVNTANTYSVVVDLNGCTATDAIDVGVLVPGAFDLGPDVQLCEGDQVVFALGIAGASYAWSTGASSSSISVNTTSTVWVNVSQGVCSTTDTVDVFVLDPGSIDLGNAITACAGAPVMLDATVPNGTYLWNTGATSAQLSITQSGTYSVVATVAQCTATDEVEVTIVPLPVVEIGDDQSICSGSSANFNATTPGASYLWQDGSTGATYSTISDEPVSVTVTLNGCSAIDSADVTVLPTPIADLGNDTTICEGASLLLDVTQAGAAYLWNNGSPNSSLLVSAEGTYSVTVDLNGCTATDAITVDVFVPSTLELGPDQLLCPGEIVSLTTGITGNHLWSTGSTSTTITVTQSGTYSVTVTVAACSVTDNVTIDYVPLVAPELANILTICMGDTAILHIDAGTASILWSTGSTSDSIIVANEDDYSVTLSLQGCTASDAIHLSVLERVDSISLGLDSIFCPNQPLVLGTTIPRAHYEWNTGATTSTISVDQAGTYSLHVTGMCIDAEASLEVIEGQCEPLVYVPNTFTPNGDGNNEFFQVFFHGPWRDYTLYIFDRWGERIFTATDPAITWDGTYNGEVVADGVYVWKIRYRSTTDEGAVAHELIGHVTVLR